MKPAKILYFVDGPHPTPDDIKASVAMKANVVFRNARAVPSEGALEECDGVAGKVPKRYADKYPDAESAIEKRDGEIAALAAKAGEVTPPAPAAKTDETDTGGKPPAAPAAAAPAAGNWGGKPPAASK